MASSNAGRRLTQRLEVTATRKQPAIERNSAIFASNPGGMLSVLSVSPHDGECLPLQAVVGQSTWRLFQACDLMSTLALLRQHEIAVVICEQNLLVGTWIDVLEQINSLPTAPSLIVASRVADERLWVEALNLGAWDVLAKPFDRNELIRSVRSAWQHWSHQIPMGAKTVKVAAAS